MKIRKWHLVAFISVLFVISFIVVNQRFDKFYRVNGINNDNRIIIETYLDEDEQEYLITNQISLDYFMDYIKLDDFTLYNYEYYYCLASYNDDYSDKEIVSIGNNLASRLEFLYDNDAYDYAEMLISNGLENAFLDNDDFDFTYIDIYITIKDLYDEKDYGYIEDVPTYIEKLGEYGIDSLDEVNETLVIMVENYNEDSLRSLLSKDYEEEVELVFDPSDYTTIVDSNHYIGEYSPSELVLILNIPRVKYSMYLVSEAYSALVDMYEDLSEEYSQFLLVDAYNSYDTLLKDDGDAGYNEEQLGYTICVSQSEISYSQFEDTELSAWLEEHAYEYGYVLRYPSHKASITGYSYDAHIYRYVGKELAKTLHDENLTLEEYVDLYQ